MGAADSYFQKAELALKKQNFDYAIELFLQGLSIDPKATAQRKRLHQVELLSIQEKGGNPQGGIGGKFKTAQNELQARKLLLQKKYDEAVMEVEKILRSQPLNHGTLWMLAQGLEGMEILDGVISACEEIIQHDKTNIEAFRKMGKTYDKMGEVDKAIAAWEKIKMYKPDDKEAGKAIRDLSAAKMVKDQEERKKGGGSYIDLLKDKTEAQNLEQKQMIIRNDDDRRRAIKFKVEEIKKDPTNSRLWRELGTLFQDLKMWEKAEESFRKAAEVNPQDLYAMEKLGTLKESRLDNELEELRKQVEAAGNGTADPALAGQLKQKESDVLLFKRDEYLRRVNAHPTDQELKVKYGKILLKCGQYDEAIGQFQKSVKDPKFRVDSHAQIGLCFKAKSLYDLAIGQFTQALSGVTDQDSQLGKDIKYALAESTELKADQEGDPARKRADYQTAVDLFQQIMSIDIGYRDVSARVDSVRRKMTS